MAIAEFMLILLHDFMKYTDGRQIIFQQLLLTVIEFPTAKKKGRVLNHKIEHCKCTKGAF